MSSPRRWFVAAAALLVAASRLPAQVSWGPAIGVNFANVAGDDVTDAKMLIGGAGGVQFDKATEGKGLFWRTGLMFSMQGSKTEDPGPPASTGKLKLSYLNIPVLAGWKFTPAKPTSPYLLIGPQIGLNAGCDIEGESGGVSATASCEDVGAPVKGFDFGGVVGAGMSMASGNSMIHIAATYTMGLTSIDDSDPAGDVKNSVFAITISYMMPGKRKVSTGN